MVFLYQEILILFILKFKLSSVRFHSNLRYLYSMKTKFSIIDKTIAGMGIEALNAMQLVAIDANEKDKDIILLSPTGSGKTLAYLLPVLLNLRQDCQKVQALVLAPSRELAQQIEQVWRSMSTGYKVNHYLIGQSNYFNISIYTIKSKNIAVKLEVFTKTPSLWSFITKHVWN